MRVTFINAPGESFTPTQSGAIATWLWETCREAAKDGVEPAVVTRDCRAAPFSWQPAVFVPFPPEPRGTLRLALARAERRLTGWTQLGHRAYALRLAAALRRTGLSQTRLVLHNDPEMAVFLRRRFPSAFIAHHFHNQLECKAAARRGLAASVNCVTAVSDFTARWVEEYYGLDRGSVPTLVNGVDLAQFRPASKVPAGLPIINFIGRMGIEKAPDLLLRAALRLAQSTRAFRLQLMGSNHWDRFEQDDYQKLLQDLIHRLEALGIEVRRTGHVARAGVPGMLRDVHIQVVPSRWDEPFGLVTLEGMASGLATVASRTGGTPEVVADAGLLFERDTEEQLCECLHALVRNDDLRAEYAGRARVRAEQFPWSRTWKSLHEQLRP